jgi:hypothetical protein
MSFGRTLFSARVRSALFLVGLLAVPPPAAAQTPDEDGRPVVMMLHGRGVQDPDSTALRREWLDALNQGLVGVGGDALLAPEDFRLVWYADALDPRAPAACAPGKPESAGGNDVAALLGAVGELMGMTADLFGDEEGDALRSLAGDLLYMGDERKRCAAEERVAEALGRAAAEKRPVVLIAHSFGSLVAYHHLQVRDTVGVAPVARLVTIGSLIGRPELREVLLGADGRHAALPPHVHSWVNVRDPEDPFAAPLAGLRTSSADGGRIVDRETERRHGSDPHDAARYLLDPATARAVLDAWCTALPGGTTERSCPE